MKPLLRNPALQERFEQDGFVVVRLFSPEQVDELLALYHRHIQEGAISGLYESSRHNTYDVNRSINEAIRGLVAQAGRDLFLPSKIYGGSFMVKSHVDSEVLPLHQDWSVVEEEQYRTLFVWSPLRDVSVANGCLFVLPGSHRYFRSLRSGSYPSDRFVLPPSLHGHTRDVALRAGEAILYSDELFHGSHANNSSSDRIVVTARVMEEAADLVYFHKASDRDVDVYQADEKLYLTHIDSLARGRVPPGARRLYRRSYSHVPLTATALEATIRRHFPASEGGFAMKPLFRDARVQADFERDGYAVIDLIDRADVDALKAFYDGLQNAPPPSSGFQVSLDNENPEFVRAVSERLIGTVRASVDRHFQHHRIFTASFVTKSRNPMGVVPPHQDWTFVDERDYWSATIWCPLVDVNMDNGALGVIKGSHRLYDHVRPSPSPQYAPPFKDQLLDIFPYLTVVDLKAGQALVFDNRTLHASPPNTTDRTRVAFGIGITHEDAKLRHYYLLPGQSRPTMEGYEVEPGFFHRYNNARLSALHETGGKPRDLMSIGVFAVTARQYETSRLVEAIRAAGNRADPRLVEKVAGIFEHMQPGNGKDGEESEAPGPSVARIEPRPPLWKVYTPANIVREIRYRLARR